MPLSPRQTALLEELSPLSFPLILGMGERAARVYAETWAECADEVRRHGVTGGEDAVRRRATSLEDGAERTVDRLAHKRGIPRIEADADAIAEAGGYTQKANLAALRHLFEKGAGGYIHDRGEALNWRFFRASICRQFIEAVEMWGQDALDVPPLPAEPAADGTASESEASAPNLGRRRVRYEHAAWMLDAFGERPPFDSYSQAGVEAEKKGLPPGAQSGPSVVRNVERLLTEDFETAELTAAGLLIGLRRWETEIRKRLAGMG